MSLGSQFTLRSAVAGLCVGTVICAANVYFGLQTGWISIMSMPASLMGFGIFRTLRHHLRFPFTPAENVFLQSVACGMAVMPLGCGLVGLIPSMEFLMTPAEHGPFPLTVAQIVIWSLGLCYFGVIFAVPLRRQVIVRERLRFPSGFSTAILISFVHGEGQHLSDDALDIAAKGRFASLIPQNRQPSGASNGLVSEVGTTASPEQEQRLGIQKTTSDWTSNMRLLAICFFLSGILTVTTYFYPPLRSVPIFGPVAAQTWLWTLNPSLAYVGQGIVMGAETTLHMTFGAIIGWALLSPLAKYNGWAPGPVNDWEQGSKGWIVWVSLAIMLADALVGLVYASLPSLLRFCFRRFTACHRPSSVRYSPISDGDISQDDQVHNSDPAHPDTGEDGSRIDQDDASPEQRISSEVVAIGLVFSVLLCVSTIYTVFDGRIPIYVTLIALLVALLLSVMGVRALGETDLNPVSGISKLAQLFFAIVVPRSHKFSVLINLVAGAIGALQAGDLMQDLKTGHLLGAAPVVQFWGQIIGATAGAVTGALIYRLYTIVYQIPGELFPVPTAYVWIFTARLVTGEGLPPMAKECALVAASLFACMSVARNASVGKAWRPWIPGGVAVAIGMYNVPSFTLARAVGGLIDWYWVGNMGQPKTPVIILASGFILGEGFWSIANLLLQAAGAPHY